MTTVNEQVQVPEAEKKDRVLKTLAVGGFIGLLVIIAWLGVQLITVMPQALTSLASIADTVYNYEPTELVVLSNKTVANAGEAFTISWSVPKQAGTFTFTYDCIDGVAVDIRTANGDIASVSCATEFDLGSVSGFDLTVNSERNRFTDIPYTIAFIPDTATEAAATETHNITVVNASITPIVAGAATSTVPDVVATEPEPTPEPVKPVPTPVVVAPKPKPTTPTPVPKPVYTQTYTYAIPVSNPNGFIDLSVRPLAVGTLDSNNRFTPASTIKTNSTGALQIEIKNIGTKTSGTFTFTVKLPNGSTYESGIQAALKPNERTIVTLGFTSGTKTGVNAFAATLDSDDDIIKTNNTFTSAVTITN